MTARHRALTTLLALIAALALAACSSGATSTSGADAATKTYAIGSRVTAPAMTDETLLGGGTFTLSSARGQVVVLNFWGSWCGPCRAEAADLESVYKSTGATFVGVNIQDQQDAATAFVRAHGITYPSVFDPAGRVMLAFRDVPPKDTPSTIVIDPTGKIAAIHLGPVTSAQLTSMIEGARST